MSAHLIYEGFTRCLDGDFFPAKYMMMEVSKFKIGTAILQ
jgi:hypothetical protein